MQDQNSQFDRKEGEVEGDKSETLVERSKQKCFMKLVKNINKVIPNNQINKQIKISQYVHKNTIKKKKDKKPINWKRNKLISG